MMLKVSVKDTGIGIRKCDQIKLFTLFGRIGNPNNLNRGGIGLGLNICKQIVQAFDGSIHIESEIHKGSKFTFFWKVEDLSSDNFLT
jgi:signal transduction histidine kinase